MKPSTKSVQFVLFAALVGTAACTAPSENATSPEEVKREASEALEAAGRYARQRGAEIEKEMRRRLEDLDADLKKLQAQAEAAGEDASKSLESEISRLRGRSQELRHDLEKAGKEGESAWEEFQQRSKAALDEIEAGLKKAGEELKGK